MTAMFAARLLCVLAVLALQPAQAAAQAQLAPVQRAPLRPVVGMAHAVDNGTNMLVLPIDRLGTTERLYVRGADLAIVSASASRCWCRPNDWNASRNSPATSRPRLKRMH
jgi:hypothetical protein